MINTETPKTALAGLQAHWKDDLRAGFSVSLIALPLCLGIALASGFPPIAGLFAAIVGGLLVSRFNGSFVTITGPAAGLIVVNLTAIETLGGGDRAVGYPYALAAILVAGIIITLFGFLKAGKFGDFFPVSVVHGMLAAIGVIIMVKQFFVAVAYTAHEHEFYAVILEMPHAFFDANPDVAVISAISLLILIFHPKVKIKFVKMIPAPIWVLAVAIPLEFIMDFEHEHLVTFLGINHKVGPQLLVHLPENILDGVVLPDFGKAMTSAFWVSVMTIALVTAIESVLSAIAVDQLDPYKRKTNLNGDLKGLGAGSAISGLIGGLPMISEIVRSSANVNNGAKTQWSNFFHAIFLLLFMLVLGPVIEHIPLAALASMLIFTGFKLASPKEFKHTLEIGKSELVVFVSTMVLVLVTDLLIGVAGGLVLNMLINLGKGVKASNLFKMHVREEVKNDTVILHLKGAMVFSNYLGLKPYIKKHANKANLILDLSGVTMIDHSVVHHLHEIEHDRHLTGKKTEQINGAHLNPVSKHPLAEVRADLQKIQFTASKRQLRLQVLAKNEGWQFQPQRQMAKKFQGFLAYQGKKLIKEKYILSWENNGHTISVSDLVIEEGAQLTKQRNIKTALFIDMNNLQVPQFALEKESFFDKMLGAAGWDDIDFKGHASFSEHYLLKGPDEHGIRTFFTEELLNYLDENRGYHMEGKPGALLVYKRVGEITPIEIKELADFADKLLHSINESALV